MKGIRHLRESLASARETLLPGVLISLAALALLVLAYLRLDPNPPRRVVLATGPAHSAYDEFGQAYRRALAPYGIDVELLPSQGSSDNLEMLRGGRADLAFVQTGAAARPRGEEEDLVTLGSLFLEPLWLFYREDKYPDEIERRSATRDIHSVAQLADLALNVGNVGSGAPALVTQLLEANKVDPAQMRLTRLEETPATAALLDGQIDALVFVSAPESMMVQMLLATPGIKLLDFSRSEAYSRRLAFLTPVMLPRGVVDLAADQPAQDVHMIATTTDLLAREGTHPAIQELFAQAAIDIHGSGGWFNRAGAFPRIQRSGYPVSSEAERAYRSGQPFLQRWLPFWMANLVERMWMAVGIIVALVLPLSRILPPLYTFRIRSRVFRWYGHLRDLERELNAHPERAPQVLRALDGLGARVESIRVPLSYAEELYALRNNIEVVRKRARGSGEG